MEQYEEISLKDLILILIKGWKIIVLSTIILMLMAVGVFFFGNKETYILNSKVHFTYSPIHTTSYGTFETKLANDEDVLALIQDDFYDELQSVTSYDFPVDDLKPFIDFSVDASNNLNIIYSGLDEVSLQNLQSNVTHTLSTYLSTQLQDKAKKQFLLELSNSMIQESNEILRNEELISLFEHELLNTNMLLNSTLINPAYATLASKIQDLKNNNLILNYTNSLNIEQVEELNTKDYEETLPFIGVFADITNDKTVINTQQFEAKTLFLISLVLGMMLGVFMVLFINYWMTQK